MLWAAEATPFAEQMRPILAELAALSGNRAAAVLNERKVATAAGGRCVLDTGHQAAPAARQAMKFLRPRRPWDVVQGGPAMMTDRRATLHRMTGCVPPRSNGFRIAARRGVGSAARIHAVVRPALRRSPPNVGGSHPHDFQFDRSPAMSHKEGDVFRATEGHHGDRGQSAASQRYLPYKIAIAVRQVLDELRENLPWQIKLLDQAAMRAHARKALARCTGLCVGCCDVQGTPARPACMAGIGKGEASRVA